MKTLQGNVIIVEYICINLAQKQHEEAASSSLEGLQSISKKDQLCIKHCILGRI